MLTVNLEKELIRQNKSVVTAKELLLIKESDSLAKVTDSGALKRVFGETAASSGDSIKRKISTELDATKDFDQSRVFHISQIEKLCKKYHLRFLPSVLFKGTIDPETANKIATFEIANNITIPHWQESRGWQTDWEGGKTYIAAPAKSFGLQKRPKDPLLFYKINESYFYLIHKWGNDISIVRRLYSLLSNKIFSFLLFLLPFLFLSIYLPASSQIYVRKEEELTGWVDLMVLSIAMCGVQILYFFIAEAPIFRIVKKNDWKSPFKD